MVELGESVFGLGVIDMAPKVPNPGQVGGPVSIPIIAPVAGVFSAYTKTKETGSVKAGVVKGTVVTGASYFASTVLAPACMVNPEPATKVVCFGILAGFSYFGNSVGDVVADSFVETAP